MLAILKLPFTSMRPHFAMLSTFRPIANFSHLLPVLTRIVRLSMGRHSIQWNTLRTKMRRSATFRQLTQATISDPSSNLRFFQAVANLLGQLQFRHFHNSWSNPIHGLKRRPFPIKKNFVSQSEPKSVFQSNGPFAREIQFRPFVVRSSDLVDPLRGRTQLLCFVVAFVGGPRGEGGSRPPVRQLWTAHHGSEEAEERQQTPSDRSIRRSEFKGKA